MIPLKWPGDAENCQELQMCSLMANGLVLVKLLTNSLRPAFNKFYGCIDVRVIFQSSHRIKSFFAYKDMINSSHMSKVVYKTSCWDCQDFYIGKTKPRLHDRKTEHFKGITTTSSPGPFPWFRGPQAREKALGTRLGSQVPVMHLLSQTTSRQLVTT